ncbi:hypothetical protein MP638_003040 [Amoeboaphelidium occidentale]|nr:hypothetical protein MP638_003040 [Amoeboaphelidium occidentale]
MLALLVGGAGILTITSSGLLPRAGPVRALVFALRSRLPISIRTADVIALRNALAVVGDQKYVVVVGQKGVAKSVLVQTVTNRSFGVVENNLANVNYGSWNPRSNAARVLWWYRRLPIPPPIAVLNATERSPGQPYADLIGAVRTLKEKFRLRVVIDGSPISLPPGLLSTERQSVLRIQPRDRETIQQLEQCKLAFEWMKSTNLENAVWAVLGGVPAKYDRLVNIIKESKLDPSKDLRIVIADFLVEEVAMAIDLIEEAIGSYPDMQKILALLDSELKMPRNAVLQNKLQCPMSDKVLRKLFRDGENYLVPANEAIALVLRHKLTKAPSLDELLDLIDQH